MKTLTVALLILLTSIPVYSQDIIPDSSDTIFEPIDSLMAGLDLALDVLKMTRDDLTFRGDYLEPDVYRLPFFDYWMEEPLKLLDIADRHLNRKYLNLCESILGSCCGPNRPEYKTLGAKSPIVENLYEGEINSTIKSAVDSIGYIHYKRLRKLISLSDSFNSPEYDQMTKPELDSLAEGFSLLLEERVEDEYLTVDEIDSLSQIEEDWSIELTRLAESWTERKKLGDDFTFATYVLDHLDAQVKMDLDDYWEAVESGTFIGIWQKMPKFKGTFNIQTDYGQIIIGDTTDNYYSGDIFIVLDPGGNDTYDIQFDGYGHHTYIIDYSGDDYYIMPKNRISPYFFGSNMIIDHEGNDIYNAGSWTLGAGLFGVGVLWDMKGNDKYFSDTFSQGAGCFGVGILRDDEGNDSYQAALFSQGFGFVQGIGVLQDNSGNDNYFAGGKYKDVLRYDDHYLSLSQGFGYGIRPKMSGGVGMLIDKKGNDTYVSDIFGQGASYWYALGILADGGGNDQYMSFQYAQGNGTHMSLGILYDVSGDDVYSAKGVSQGCGHDRAAGLLIDLDGNDSYNSFDLCQGAGSANGLGIIADVRGNDAYIARSDKNTQGYGNPRRDYGSIGIFIDLGGVDGYSGGLGRDNHWWSYSKWGVGIDK